MLFYNKKMYHHKEGYSKPNRLHNDLWYVNKSYIFKNNYFIKYIGINIKITKMNKKDH